MKSSYHLVVQNNSSAMLCSTLGSTSIKRTRKPILTVLLAYALLASAPAALAQTPPPSLGEETKGEPAVDETKPIPREQSARASATEPETESLSNSLLGEATITESRRESGQVYRIELEHSSGSKQYIEENDSDGNIESTRTDIEDTPNLPKWKLGSW